eukprot:43297-Eustigmatos_ZCMA.PRE.1
MAIATAATANICVDAVPPYLRDRVERGEQLPRVEVQRDAGSRGVEMQQQQQRGDDQHGEEEEEVRVSLSLYTCVYVRTWASCRLSLCLDGSLYRAYSLD